MRLGHGRSRPTGADRDLGVVHSLRHQSQDIALPEVRLPRRGSAGAAPAGLLRRNRRDQCLGEYGIDECVPRGNRPHRLHQPTYRPASAPRASTWSPSPGLTTPTSRPSPVLARLGNVGPAALLIRSPVRPRPKPSRRSGQRCPAPGRRPQLRGDRPPTSIPPTKRLPSGASSIRRSGRSERTHRRWFGLRRRWSWNPSRWSNGPAP